MFIYHIEYIGYKRYPLLIQMFYIYLNPKGTWRFFENCKLFWTIKSEVLVLYEGKTGTLICYWVYIRISGSHITIKGFNFI